MLPYFSQLFISEQIGFSKPSAEFFNACLKRLNETEPVFPEDVVMVGDSLSSDIAGGIAAGMQTVYYNPRNKEIPSEIKPDHVIRSLFELWEIL